LQLLLGKEASTRGSIEVVESQRLVRPPGGVHRVTTHSTEPSGVSVDGGQGGVESPGGEQQFDLAVAPVAGALVVVPGVVTVVQPL